jgi:hypothetical protein
MTTAMHEPTNQNGNTQQPQPADPPNLPVKPSLFALLFRHWRFVGVLLLLLTIAGTYLWKNIAVARAKAQAAVVIGKQGEVYLRLVAVPLVWTVRSEMLRGNYDQINQYLAQFVREPNMKEVLVARIDGKIIAATNKQREGAPLADLFPPEVQQVETITVKTEPDGTMQVTAPVMGLNEKLGILILIAAPPADNLAAPSR